MYPMKRDSSAKREVGFPLPPESELLPARLRALNAILVIGLASFGFWMCHQYQIWNLGQGTFLHFFLHRFWMIIPIVVAILPVAAYSLPLLYLQKQRNRNEPISITQDNEPRKLR